MIDEDDTTPMGNKLVALYTELNSAVEEVLLRFDWDDLLILNLVYGEQLHYPVNDHITRLLNTEPSEKETVH